MDRFEVVGVRDLACRLKEEHALAERLGRMERGRVLFADLLDQVVERVGALHELALMAWKVHRASRLRGRGVDSLSMKRGDSLAKNHGNS